MPSISPSARYPGPAGCVSCLGYSVILLMIGAIVGLGGLVNLILLPLYGLAVLALAYIVGLAFRVPGVRSVWERGVWLALLCGIIGAGLYALGLRSIEWPDFPPDVDPDSVAMPDAGIGTYFGLFLVVFTI